MADNANVTSNSDLFKSQASEQVNQHLVFDGQDRPILIFTASIGTVNGGPCSVTEYVYRGLTSSQITSRQERVSTWNTAWEAAFIFNPTVSYDVDGDGVL